MSPEIEEAGEAPVRRRRRELRVELVDPHCEHCGAEAHYVPTAQHWIHRRGAEACGYVILKPTEGRTIFEAPPARAKKVSIYLLPSQEPQSGEAAPRARRRLNKSSQSKPTKSRRWS